VDAVSEPYGFFAWSAKSKFARGAISAAVLVWRRLFSAGGGLLHRIGRGGATWRGCAAPSRRRPGEASASGFPRPLSSGEAQQSHTIARAQWLLRHLALAPFSARERAARREARPGLAPARKRGKLAGRAVRRGLSGARAGCHLKPCRCTTYHSPRHEISDVSSKSRSLPLGSVKCKCERSTRK
jgi:hypothetical protein